MAGGGGHEDEAKFTGLSKHFNTFTIRGRANISMATLSGLGLLILYFKLKPSKK